MNLNARTATDKATPEHVLSVIRDSHRQQCQYDPDAEPDVYLTFDSTVAEWRIACDLRAWRGLSTALADRFGVEMTRGEWKQLLVPAKKRRLRQVCEAIALRTTRERILPVRLPARAVTFGELQTFRDLVHALIGNEEGAIGNSIRF